MKPGKNDIAIKIKISGIQLEELKKHTWAMCEAFGLDNKVSKYKGTRPISFYSWDLDCILDVLDTALTDEREYPDKKEEGYIKLHELYVKLKKLYKEAYADRDHRLTNQCSRRPSAAADRQEGR